MPTRPVVRTLLTFAAGAAVAVVARRLARHRSAAAVAADAAPAAVAPVAAPSVEVEVEAVVLPFSRPAAPAPAQRAAPARCGQNGGRTKAGAPCAARATSGGRCHHHRVAA